ncbi:MAG: amidohydrolase family protein [Candidatus Acidiferrales bacterium]
MRHPNAGAGIAAVDADRPNGEAFRSEPSRRRFLRFMAVAGASAILPADGLLAQVSSAVAGMKGRIDVHHHLLPPFYVKVMEKEVAASGRPVPSWTPDKSIEAMDRSGIATAIVSPLLHLVQDSLSDQSERARSLARQHNEYGAQLVKDHPGRFGLFAVLPLPDQEGSLQEIAYALDTLRVDGIGLWTSYRDKWPGDPAFAPAFEELNRRKAVVFFHPAAPSCCRTLIPGVGENVAEYDFDTTRAIASLLANGAFGRYPDIRFIFCHSGGTMPVLANRVSEYFPKKGAEGAPGGVREELKQIYYEVAHATYPEPLSALTKLVATSQILFGSDFPIVAYPTTTGGLDHFGFSANGLQAINRGNAERLFPRLKA